MKKLILTALLAVVTLCTVAPIASASSTYLSMAAGKAQARKDTRYIVDGQPFRLSCYRVSRSTIECDWTSQEDGSMECTGSLRERRSYTGNIIYSTVATADCYYT